MQLSLSFTTCLMLLLPVYYLYSFRHSYLELSLSFTTCLVLLLPVYFTFVAYFLLPNCSSSIAPPQLLLLNCSSSIAPPQLLLLNCSTSLLPLVSLNYIILL